MKKVNEKIMFSVLTPLGCAILLLMGAFIFSIYRLQQQNINSDVRESLDRVQKFFRARLEEDSSLLSAIIELMEKDINLQNAWLAKDRETLLTYTVPILEQFSSKYRVTHFYFHDPNKVCFLRVHNPQRYGDHINRFTLDSAVREQKPAYGIELGPLGTFTLRVVYPWYIEGMLTGYIELGEEIEHITPELEEIHNVDLIFIINKSYLNRADWEEGMKMLGRSGNWDLLPHFVITNSTVNDIPKEFVKHVETSKAEDKNLLLEMSDEEKTYKSSFVPLVDVGGREVGAIYIMKDITNKEASLRTLSKIVVIICLIIGSMVIGFFGLYIGRIEKKLLIAHKSLKNEIEKRRVIENELIRHRQNLEDLIEERTTELKHSKELLENLNNELESTIYELQQSNRQLRDFAYIAAHDLKTPLRGIATLSYWLSTDYVDKFDDQGQKKIKLLTSRAKRTIKLVDSILEYSKIKLNKQKEEQVDLNRLVTEIIQNIALQTNIEIVIWNTLPKIQCERNHFAQLFYHLLNNAVTYMDKPLGRIKIGCIEDNGFWKFSIADNGPGIEAKYFKKIFQIFQTLSAQDDFESTGVGLTLVKKIVELYGGKIWIESKVGRGSTFLFTLPKQYERVQNEQPQTNFIN